MNRKTEILVASLFLVLAGCQLTGPELLGKRPSNREELTSSYGDSYGDSNCWEESFGESSTTSDSSGSCPEVEWWLEGVSAPEDGVVVFQVEKLSDQTYPRVSVLQYQDVGSGNRPNFDFQCEPPVENPDRRTANVRCTGPTSARIRATLQEPSDVSLRISWLIISHASCYNSVTYTRAARRVLCGTSAGPAQVNGVSMPTLWRDVP